MKDRQHNRKVVTQQGSQRTSMWGARWLSWPRSQVNIEDIPDDNPEPRASLISNGSVSQSDFSIPEDDPVTLIEERMPVRGAEGFGVKTISFFGGLCLLVNNMTGPGTFSLQFNPVVLTNSRDISASKHPCSISTSWISTVR